MGFVLKIVVAGMLTSLGFDLYKWAKIKLQDMDLNETRNLLRHFFSVKATK